MNKQKTTKDKMDEIIEDLGLDKHIPYEIQ